MYRRLTRLVAISAILAIATGCLSSIASDSYCLVAKPIHGDPVNDTPETMRQIDAHNAVGVELCGW